MKQPKLLRLAIMAVSLAVFCYAGYQLFDYFTENRRSEQSTEQLIEQAVQIREPAETHPQPSGTGETEPWVDPTPISVDFGLLQAQNPDIIAWIYSPDTPINYPVVQGEDNQYYLRRLTDGSSNVAGTIFMDFRNSPDLSDRNSLIYGHNMTNDSMFGTFSEYRRQAYYEAHPTMWLLTPERSFRVELIAGFVTRADSDSYTLFETAEELQEYLEEAAGRSTFDAQADLTQVSRIVTLSTCTYEGDDQRYILIGTLHEIGQE